MCPVAAKKTPAAERSSLLRTRSVRLFTTVLLYYGHSSLTTPVAAFSRPVSVSRPIHDSIAFAPLQYGMSKHTIVTQFATSKDDDNDDTPVAVASTNEVLADAESALTNVGWMLPEEGELTSDDPFVKRIDAEIQRDIGVSLDELLNPAKVVNLERDLYELRTQLARATGKELTTEELGLSLTTEQCDNGGGGDQAEELRKQISKKETSLALERRSVFQGWLKTVFLVQAVISFGLSYVMATNPAALFGGFSWFNAPKYNMDVSIQVLGYWWWWLFVVPSLRSRRPKGDEKRALDLAFVGTPAISLLAPVFTKDTGIIWAANFAVVAASYAYAFLIPESDDDESDSDDESGTPGWLKFVFKSLDFGSGRERGARK